MHITLKLIPKAGTKRVEEKLKTKIAEKSKKSLLKYGTWAYYGNGNGRFPSDHYRFLDFFRHQ